MFVYNSANMKAFQEDTAEEIVSIDKDGYDSLSGYTTDTMDVPTKDSKQTMRSCKVCRLYLAPSVPG